MFYVRRAIQSYSFIRLLVRIIIEYKNKNSDFLKVFEFEFLVSTISFVVTLTETVQEYFAIRKIDLVLRSRE